MAPSIRGVVSRGPSEAPPPRAPHGAGAPSAGPAQRPGAVPRSAAAPADRPTTTTTRHEHRLPSVALGLSRVSSAPPSRPRVGGGRGYYVSRRRHRRRRRLRRSARRLHRRRRRRWGSWGPSTSRAPTSAARALTTAPGTPAGRGLRGAGRGGARREGRAGTGRDEGRPPTPAKDQASPPAGPLHAGGVSAPRIRAPRAVPTQPRDVFPFRGAPAAAPDPDTPGAAVDSPTPPPPSRPGSARGGRGRGSRGVLGAGMVGQRATPWKEKARSTTSAAFHRAEPPEGPGTARRARPPSRPKPHLSPGYT